MSIVMVDFCGQWCYSEYQFSLDSIEGKGTVIDVEEESVRASLRRRTRVTFYNLVVESEHGELRIGATESVPIGSTVHYEFSPTQQTARFHGESMFWETMLGTMLFVAIGIFSLFLLVLAYLCSGGKRAVDEENTQQPIP
ncbi:hypothetical protein NG895_21110 [Aeoliella sp. ICT_H6.2]|uniref:Uncharacterized protein n=1 Tax=Aeoliella straminimaris TaxID=2954799 RepID=A0A9X2JHU4_9BACT|nr:hypothetical protein [Aeoliella straminimaris]MCO6046405.1 hypothetical protein [Aeoliella straminimaris]